LFSSFIGKPCFNFEFFDVPADFEFICRKYFADEKVELPNRSKIAVNTLLKHRRTIGALYNYQFGGSRERKMIEQTAQNAAKISSKRLQIILQNK
jgi:hypothetical protein